MKKSQRNTHPLDRNQDLCADICSRADWSAERSADGESVSGQGIRAVEMHP